MRAASLLLSLVPFAPLASAQVAAAPDPRLDWWREARFGLFVHFGLYAVPEGRWGDRDGYGEWLLSSAKIPLPEYEALAARFTVDRFDAAEWARLAKRAGMGYVVVTTKHHDGFCLFDSAHTDWDVERTPFGRDLARELADATRAAGLRIGWYHSIMDWHHADYLPRREWDPRPAADADMDRYTRHLGAQVEELLTRYGPVDLMWFDGQWESTWNHARGQALYDLCRRLQPGVIVNNRVDGGFGQDGLTSDPRFAGDYGTPEQNVPTAPPPGVDWETCLTMNRHWGWNAADKQWKSATALLHTLIDVVSKGGNLLLNVGPRPDGTFPPLAVERLEAIGAWMDVNGAAIRGAGRSAFTAPEGCRLTEAPMSGGTRLFVHVLEPATLRSLAAGTFTLTSVGNEVTRAFPLAAPDRALRVTRDAARPCDVTLAGEVTADPHATVLVLELAGAPVPCLPPTISAPTASFVARTRVRVEPSAPSLGLEVEYAGRTTRTEAGGLELVLADTSEVVTWTTKGGVRVGAPARRTFTRVAPRPATELDPEATQPGLALTVVEGTFEVVPAPPPLVGDEAVVGAVALPAELAREHVSAFFRGFIDTTLLLGEAGVVTFELASDDGSRLWIGDQLVVDNDGLHGYRPVRGEVALAPGWHPITVGWFNQTGGAELALHAVRDDGTRTSLTAAPLRTP